MPLFVRNSLVLAKIEPTSGTDSVPTGAQNAMLVSNLSPRALEADLQDREFFTGHFGHQSQLTTNRRMGVDFDIEVAGSGDIDTPPAWAPLLRACGFSETINAGASVEYLPKSTSFETLSIYFYLDGIVHKMLGAVGTFSANLSPGQVPKLSFSFTGNYAGPADQANPTATTSAFQAPVAVDSTSSTFMLHGFAARTSEFTVDVANNIISEDLINGRLIAITDRAPTGSVTIDATPVASKDWVTICSGQTLGSVDFTLGTVVGNRVRVSCPSVSLNSPTYGDRDSTRTLQLGMRLVASDSGNDELRIITS